jgi:cytochrome c-type biogenesis protein CcmH
MHNRTFLIAGILVLLASFVPIFAINAQEPTPSDDEVNAIAKQLYCPVCENIPLDVCPTQACVQWRGVIREKLALGWDEGQIKQYFVDQYGDRVLSTPPATGFNWLAYILPPVVFVIGVIILLRIFKNWRETPQQVVSKVREQAEASQDPYVRMLEEQLRERERMGES